VKINIVLVGNTGKQMRPIIVVFVFITLIIALANMDTFSNIVLVLATPEDSSFTDSDNLFLSNFSGLEDFSGPASMSMDPLSNMPFDLKGIENLFLGKSLLGAIGVSMVENVSISGIQLIDESTLSINLDRSDGNGSAPLVTIIAYKISLNNSDISTIVKSMSNNTYMNMPQDDNNMYAADKSFNQASPLSILEKFQIGSSSITNSSWTSPHTLTMKLVKSTDDLSNFDFVLVTALPYTGTES
jgi:hypothetical protein